jgi:hypothetical protein
MSGLVYFDVDKLRKESLRYRASPLAEARRKLSGPVRGWLKKLMRPREGTRVAIARAFRSARLGAGRREVAVAATLAHASFELLKAVRGASELGATTFEYFAEIWDLQHSGPPQHAPRFFVQGLVLAARSGTWYLRTRVAKEATDRLRLTAPDAELLRVVDRYLDRFRAIANEAVRLALAHGQAIPASIETNARALARATGRELAGAVGATSA